MGELSKPPTTSIMRSYSGGLKLPHVLDKKNYNMSAIEILVSLTQQSKVIISGGIQYIKEYILIN